MSSKRILSIGSKPDYRLEPDYVAARKRQEEERMIRSAKPSKNNVGIHIYTGIDGMKAFDKVMTELIKKEIGL